MIFSPERTDYEEGVRLLLHSLFKLPPMYFPLGPGAQGLEVLPLSECYPAIGIVRTCLRAAGVLIAAVMDDGGNHGR